MYLHSSKLQQISIWKSSEVDRRYCGVWGRWWCYKMTSNGSNALQFEEKLNLLVQNINNVKSNNKTPAWMKPFLDSMKTFATDVGNHVSLLEASVNFSKTVVGNTLTNLRNDLDEQQLIGELKYMPRQVLGTRPRQALQSRWTNESYKLIPA